MKIEPNNCYNINCMEGMKLMKGQGVKADCLLTDLPYGEVNRKSNGLRTLDKANADSTTFDLMAYLNSVIQVIKGNFLIFCGIEQVSAIRKFFVEHDMTTRLLIWEKTNPSPMNGQTVYLSGIECCVYAKARGGVFNGFCKNTVFRYPRGTNDIHPTMKPLGLWYELLRDNTNEGQIVLDTCMGSWTTAVACHKLNRSWIGFELNEEYYKKGQQRYLETISQLSVWDI